MLELSLSGSINRVSVEQSFNWISQSFKMMTKYPKVMLCNILLYGLFSALGNLMMAQSIIGLLIYLLYFQVLGSIIINLHHSREVNDFVPKFYHGFKSPHFKRLLKVSIYMGISITVVIVLIYFLMDYLFTEEDIALLGKIKAYLDSVGPNFNPQTSINDLAASVGVDFAKLSQFIVKMMGLIIFLLVLFTAIILVFSLVPFFIVLTYTEVKTRQVNMYKLSFLVFLKLANFLPYFLFGLVTGFGSIFYLSFTASLVSVLGLPVPLTIVINNLVNAPLTVFFIYCMYFAFIDLFCDKTVKKAGEINSDVIKSFEV